MAVRLVITQCLEASASAGSSNQTVFSGFQTTNGTTGASTFEVAINNDPSTLKAGQTYAAATKFGETNHSALLYFPMIRIFMRYNRATRQVQR